MEKLGQLRARDEWDLIVVDTPPSRSALDFLDAPKRLGSFLDGRFIRVLMAPAKVGGRAGMKFLNVGMSMMTGALGKLLGGQLLQGRADVRGRDGHHVRRLPHARGRHVPAAPGARHGVPGGGRARSGTRCARRRTSWSGWPPRTCRWPGWCSTGCTAAAPPSCPPSGRWPPRKILKSPALWIRTDGKAGLRNSPDTYGSSDSSGSPKRPHDRTPGRLDPADRTTDADRASTGRRRRTGPWNSSPRACCGCTPSACSCSPASSARGTASPRCTPRWRWPKWPRCPATSTTWRGCGTSATGSRPGGRCDAAGPAATLHERSTPEAVPARRRGQCPGAADGRLRR